ncbi:MAG TPA: hypothetical protein VMR21_03155 [Vicinamibacteria bacterium]|nr:hypothetical protein [Vicinamibacteria bacterium]
MFVGHYGPSFAAKRVDPTLPLWLLFIAVQFLDVVWAPLVLLGIEKVRIVPGITRSNPLDLYYMPYTHSLVAAIAWSVSFAAVHWLATGRRRTASSALLGAAVFSHWLLDLVVHRPDLPLFDNAAKVGLGLWNRPVLAFGLEAFLLLGGIAWCARKGLVHLWRAVAFGLVMAAVQAAVFFGPPPASPRAAALTALTAYAVFAAIIHWIEKRPAADRHPPALAR